jgi:hypothetical protein
MYYCRHAVFFATEKKRIGISSLTTNKQTNKKKKKTGKYKANEKEKQADVSIAQDNIKEKQNIVNTKRFSCLQTH